MELQRKGRVYCWLCTSLCCASSNVSIPPRIKEAGIETYHHHARVTPPRIILHDAPPSATLCRGYRHLHTLVQSRYHRNRLHTDAYCACMEWVGSCRSQRQQLNSPSPSTVDMSMPTVRSNSQSSAKHGCLAGRRLPRSDAAYRRLLRNPTAWRRISRTAVASLGAMHIRSASTNLLLPARVLLFVKMQNHGNVTNVTGTM